MKLPDTNEPVQEPADDKSNNPAALRTVHIVAARKPATPSQAASELKAVLPPPEEKKEEPKPSSESPALAEKPARSKGINPGKKLRSIIHAGKNAPRIKIPLKYRLRPDKSLLRRAVWDVSSIISLVVNIVLVVIVVILGTRLQLLQNTVNSLLGGLYDNFVRMDNSVISTTVSINQYPIPIDFMLPVVQEETYVTLTRDVTVRGAMVGILSVPTTVTLPRGTALPISLNIEVPVKTTVLADLVVPVNIKLREALPTDSNTANLHSSFIGLQNTIGPLYCLLQPGAKDYTGAAICQQGAYSLKPLR